MPHDRTHPILTLVGTLLALLLSLSPARAESKNDLSFSAGTYVGASDNASGAMTAIARESDFWWGGSVGASYTRRLTFGDFSLNAGGYGSVHSADDRWNQIFGNVSASLRVPITSRLVWGVEDRFTPSAISFADVDTARSNQTQINDAKTWLEYVVPIRGRWSVRTRGSFSRQDIFDIDNIFAGLEPDRYAVDGSLSIERKFGSRWALGISGYGGRTIFINNSPTFVDTTGYGGSLEASYSVRQNTRFFGSVGAGQIRSSTVDSTNLLWSLGVDWQIFKRLGLRIEGRRTHTVLLTGSNAVVSSVDADLDYTLSTRVSMNLRGVWQHTDGVTGLAPFLGNDQVFHVSPSLSYRMGRHFTLSASYAYTRNGGDDVPANDFTRNTGVLGFTAEF